MRPAGTPARRVLKPGGASGNARTSSGPSTMGLPMLPRPCAGGGPWGFSWAGAAAAATSNRIVVLDTWALFFIMFLPVQQKENAPSPFLPYSDPRVFQSTGSTDMKLSLTILLCVAACTASFAHAQEIVVGLITKTDTNPFFVKMKEGAMEAAKAKGAKLMSAAGKFDGDNATQVTAIENMVSGGAKAILITPSDTKAIVPAIKKARDAGVLVIALDTPTDPQSATDALFATDNFNAGVLIGQYARAAMAGTPARIVTLDLAPGVTVGKLRHDGFLRGFGIQHGDPSIVCSQDTQGNQAKGQTAMENCLQRAPDTNVVYAINEPAAAGAYQALKAAGKEKGVLIVSVDGGCAGVKNV